MEHNNTSLSTSLLRAFAIGCTVEIYRDMNMCYVELVHKKSMHQRGQYLPLDDHLDYALPGCIDHCVKQLLTDIDQKQI